METFDPFSPSDPINSPARGADIGYPNVNINVTEPEIENEHNRIHNNYSCNNGHDNEDDIHITVNTNTNTNTNNDDETDTYNVDDRDHGRNSNCNNGTDGRDDRKIETRNDENDDDDEEDEIAFAAEAAANAVEEADAEQHRLDQALLRCRICGQGAMEGRPILRFLPMNPALANLTAQALPPGSPLLATFPEDICLHIFCGKTASILPAVNQPDMEILTKAGIKNKHGIGAEVNAALARTRCANIVTLTVGVVGDAEETPSSATPNANAINKQEKQYFLVREFEAHLAAIRSAHQTALAPPLHLQVPLPLPVQVPGSFLGDPAHASQRSHLPNVPSSTTTKSNGPDGAKHQRAFSQTNAHSTSISSSTSAGNNLLSCPYYFMSQGLIPVATNHGALPPLSTDRSAAPSTPQISPDAPSKSQTQSPASQKSTRVFSTATIIGSPSIMHNNYSSMTMSSMNPPVNLLAHNGASPVYSQSLSESQAILCAGAVGGATTPLLRTAGDVPLPQTMSSGSFLTPPVAMGMSIGMDKIEQEDQATQSVSTDEGVAVATQRQNGAAGTTPIIPTRATAGKTLVKPKLSKENMHSIGEYYSSPPENQPCTSDGKVKCDCGGTYMDTGTPKGAASWRSHVVTKRHQKWLRTHSQNTQAGNNVYV